MRRTIKEVQEIAPKHTDAAWRHPAHTAAEPFDCQLEYDLRAAGKV